MTQRSIYPANRTFPKIAAAIAVLIIAAGCASWLFANPFPDVTHAPQLLLELEATLSAYEDASLPPDASPEQLLAFHAIQLARRALVLQFIAYIQSTAPELLLNEYRDRLAQADAIEPEPD